MRLRIVGRLEKVMSLRTSTQERILKSSFGRIPLVFGCLLTSAVTCTFIPSAFAQVISGTISGTVQDSSGAVIPNASVVLTNSTTGDQRTSTSNSGGLFSFTGLPSGDFSISITDVGLW